MGVDWLVDFFFFFRQEKIPQTKNRPSGNPVRFWDRVMGEIRCHQVKSGEIRAPWLAAVAAGRGGFGGVCGAWVRGGRKSRRCAVVWRETSIGAKENPADA